MFIMKYSKNQYSGKLKEIQVCYDRLKMHLERMEELKGDMGSFWHDEQARKAGELLTVEIRQVRNAMERTQDMLQFYTGAIESLTDVGEEALSDISSVLNVVDGLGI